MKTRITILLISICLFSNGQQMQWLLTQSSATESFVTQTITGSTDGALTDYQLKVIVDYGSGTNTGEKVFLAGDCRTDFADIRFKDSSGSTSLDYWLETKENSDSAVFWVEVPSLAASPTTTDIRLYYGLETATASNGANTFPLFQGFSNTKTNQFLLGGDTGWANSFCPTNRRIYRFNSETGGGTTVYGVQWVDIDTWEAGFVYLPNFSINSATSVWHPIEEKFYIYGGRSATSSFSDKIFSFDPATNVATELTEKLDTGLAIPTAVYSPVDSLVYVFGGMVTLAGYVYSNKIQVHDPNAGTCTDTGADLPTAANGIGVAYSSEDSTIYLFGGAYNNGGSINSLSTINSYDPLNNSTNPSSTGETLPTGLDTEATTYYNGYCYLFGGYDFTTATYYDIVQKYDVSTSTISTVSGQTLPKADDDGTAFYDESTGKIYISPWIHSTGTTNENRRKVVVNEYNPSADTFYTEASLGSIPTGWTNGGTNTYTTYEAAQTKMSVQDWNSSGYTAAYYTNASALSGKYVVEVGMNINYSPVGDVNPAIRLGNSSLTVGTSSTNGICNIQFSATGQLTLYNGSFNDIAALASGQERFIYGVKLDSGSNNAIGQVDRGSSTSSLSYWNNTSMQRVLVNTSTAGVGGFGVDWIIGRKWTTNEPSRGNWN